MLKNLKDFSGAWSLSLTALPALRWGVLVLMAGVCFLLPLGKQGSLAAQPKDNAPYSRFGLGEPVNHSFSSAGFGGLTAAYADPLYINLHNPASLGTLMSTTFGVGVFAERSTLDFQGQKAPVWTGNMSHLSLAFPLRNTLNDALDKKKRKVLWAMNIALLPNTLIGYDIETQEVLSEGDTTLNSFQGTGGTNRLVWGNGFRYKNLSLGLNISYLFGQLESDRFVQFQNRLGVFDDSYQDYTSIRGVIWTLGAQYQLDLEKKKEKDGTIRSVKSLIFGAYGNPSTSFSTSSTQLRIGLNRDLNPIITDTLLNERDVEGNGKMPSEWTFGVTYQNAGKLRLGLEYSHAAWSNYENDAKPETLFNSRRFSVGAEFIPDATSYNKYYKRVRYRAGFYHRTDPRLADLDQYAVTMGLGLPVILPRGQTSFVNLAVEIGKYSTSDAINENFVKMSLGFTLNDNSWFYKRKFR